MCKIKMCTIFIQIKLFYKAPNQSSLIEIIQSFGFNLLNSQISDGLYLLCKCRFENLQPYSLTMKYHHIPKIYFNEQKTRSNKDCHGLISVTKTILGCEPLIIRFVLINTEKYHGHIVGRKTFIIFLIKRWYIQCRPTEVIHNYLLAN